MGWTIFTDEEIWSNLCIPDERTEENEGKSKQQQKMIYMALHM